MKRDAERAIALGQDLARALRALRKDMRRCARCPYKESCETYNSFNAQVQAAIEEINDEWGWTG